MPPKASGRGEGRAVESESPFPTYSEEQVGESIEGENDPPLPPHIEQQGERVEFVDPPAPLKMPPQGVQRVQLDEAELARAMLEFLHHYQADAWCGTIGSSVPAYSTQSSKPSIGSSSSSVSRPPITHQGTSRQNIVPS
ncbi:hypothetical protein F0562_015193 [Nyssa sinensis]|uniref:Uncharacterized protein n=1 Tax=Nyssa sinensis TaxID=561372 RepID=A0A5J4ZJP2_9ASTE|nr:hypothetical protein F0562_015193 [Nyssa sinensis]